MSQTNRHVLNTLLQVGVGCAVVVSGDVYGIIAAVVGASALLGGASLGWRGGLIGYHVLRYVFCLLACYMVGRYIVLVDLPWWYGLAGMSLVCFETAAGLERAASKHVEELRPKHTVWAHCPGCQHSHQVPMKSGDDLAFVRGGFIIATCPACLEKERSE